MGHDKSRRRREREERKKTKRREQDKKRGEHDKLRKQRARLREERDKREEQEYARRREERKKRDQLEEEERRQRAQREYRRSGESRDRRSGYGSRGHGSRGRRRSGYGSRGRRRSGYGSRGSSRGYDSSRGHGSSRGYDSSRGHGSSRGYDPRTRTSRRPSSLKQGPASGRRINMNETVEIKLDDGSAFPEIKHEPVSDKHTASKQTKPRTRSYNQPQTLDAIIARNEANRKQRKRCGKLQDMGAPENVVYDKHGNMGRILEGQTKQGQLYFKILDEENRKRIWVALSTLQRENKDKHSLIDVWCKKIQNCDNKAGETCPSEENCSVNSYPKEQDVQRNCAK